MKINRFVCIALCLLVICTSLHAKEENIISGRVVDEQGEPLAYVNVGIVNQDIGCVTDKNGIYEINVPLLLATSEIIRFSHLGYKSESMTIQEFKLTYLQDSKCQDIVLSAEAFEIPEAVISAKSNKKKIIGLRKKKNGIVVAGFNGVEKGYELGSVLKVKRKSILDAVVIQVATNNCSDLLLRLNIYNKNQSADNQWEPLHSKPIYINIPKATEGDIIVKLDELDLGTIIIEDDIMLAVEWLGEKDEGAFFLRASLIGKTMSRKTSQGEWIQTKIGVAISADIVNFVTDN